MSVLALVGTRKGLFLLESDEERQDWSLEGPVLTGWSVFHAVVDPNNRGKGLQARFIVEDPHYFTMPWTGLATYRRAGSAWIENVCAENVREYYANRDTPVPRADAPDF